MRKEDRVVCVSDPAQPLSAGEKAELEALAAMPDETIDYSDIPELTDKFWRNAIPNPYYRPVKRQLTVRIDADVLAWLRSTGRGYQTKLNDILRKAMVKDAAEG